MKDEAAVLFFVDNPGPGEIKPRIAEILGDEETIRLYRQFVLDMLDGLRRVVAELTVCHHPSDARSGMAVRQWLGEDLTYMPQSGATRGDRLRGCLAQAFDRGFQRTLVLCSDVPDYPAALVQKALGDLAFRGAVLGPSLDGGCYLIGFRKEAFAPQAFDSPWDGTDTYATVKERLLAAGCESAVLPEWNRVETVRDLNVLWRSNEHSSFKLSRTWVELVRHSDLLARYDQHPPHIED